MTQQPYDRRRNDVRLDELIAKVDAISEKQDRHLAEFHGNLQPGQVSALVAEHADMRVQVDSNKELLTKLVNLLEGQDIYSDLDPSIVIDHQPGLLYEVRTLRKQSQNGGIHAKVQLTGFQKALITGSLTVLAGIFTLLIEIVQRM